MLPYKCESRKVTRPFRCDLYKIPYDYTVEITNRFQGLDMVDRVPELWTEVCNIVQDTVTKIISKKKKCKKAKWLFKEALQISEERKEAKSRGERERYTQLNAKFQRKARRDKKAFLKQGNRNCNQKSSSKQKPRTRWLHS